MLQRVDSEELARASQLPIAAAAIEPAVTAVGESELETSLPHDHPRWVRDTIALSSAARRLLERVKPVVIAVMSMWDHRLRCIAVGGYRVGVDASGSYRITE